MVLERGASVACLRRTRREKKTGDLFYFAAGNEAVYGIKLGEGFALPGALGVKLAQPESKVLAVVGDGAFLMNSQEIETAVRERIPLVVLIWEDGAYGLIQWKMDLELGAHYYVRFGNLDIVTYADSFGAKGYRINSPEELLPTLRAALDDDGVSLISCPVDYGENLRLTDHLGELDETL